MRYPNFYDVNDYNDLDLSAKFVTHECGQRCVRHSIHITGVHDFSGRINKHIGRYFCQKCVTYFKHPDKKHMTISRAQYTNRIVLTAFLLRARNYTLEGVTEFLSKYSQDNHAYKISTVHSWIKNPLMKAIQPSDSKVNAYFDQLHDYIKRVYGVAIKVPSPWYT